MLYVYVFLCVDFIFACLFVRKKYAFLSLSFTSKSVVFVNIVRASFVFVFTKSYL